MQILTHPAQLQRLEGILRKSLPLALPVFGAVLNISRGNPGQFEVLVDKWPEFGAWEVLGRDLGVLGSTVAGFGGAGVHRGIALLGSLGAGSWGALGLDLGVLGARLGYWAHWKQGPAPGVRVGSLQPSHVDLLNATWPYGGNARSRRYLAGILGRFPQVCLQDGGGQPVAWVLTDHFGTGTHSYTLPEQRRRGHMQVALTVAAQRAQARGFPTFG
ncbi:GLYL3 protein, partial [Struthidea cinerea]|nr:GLYL3 protein [Struthidea cinerea]